MTRRSKSHREKNLVHPCLNTVHKIREPPRIACHWTHSAHEGKWMFDLRMVNLSQPKELLLGWCSCFCVRELGVGEICPLLKNSILKPEKLRDGGRNRHCDTDVIAWSSELTGPCGCINVYATQNEPDELLNLLQYLSYCLKSTLAILMSYYVMSVSRF